MNKIRLARQGRTHKAHYRVVVANAKSPRDGRFTEKIGYFDPHTNTVHISVERAVYWLQQGAQPTPRVRSLLSALGVMLAVYLMNGFRRGKVAKPVMLKRLSDWEKEVGKRKEPKVNFAGTFSVRNLLESLPDVPGGEKKLTAKKMPAPAATPSPEKTSKG